MEDDAKNFVESGRPESAQNSTSNDWHISAEKERRVFRELEPSELDKDEGEAFHKGIHTWTTELKALPNTRFFFIPSALDRGCFTGYSSSSFSLFKTSSQVYEKGIRGGA